MSKEILDTILDKKSEAEATEVVDFLKGLSSEEKKEFMIFLKGARFHKSLTAGRTAR